MDLNRLKKYRYAVENYQNAVENFNAFCVMVSSPATQRYGAELGGNPEDTRGLFIDKKKKLKEVVEHWCAEVEKELELLQWLCSHLSPSESDCILAKYRDGRTVMEIAWKRKCGTNNVKKILKRARAKLATIELQGEQGF